MNEGNSRRPAVIGHNRSRMPWRFIAVCTVVMAVAVTVGAVIDAAPAQGDTSSRYQRLWDGLSDGNKRWARQTARCESGGDRDIHGGGGAYHGAYQFMLETWRNSPKSPGGDPHRHSKRTQAVVAVYLKKQDGARTHWPSCG